MGVIIRKKTNSEFQRICEFFSSSNFTTSNLEFFLEILSVSHGAVMFFLIFKLQLL